MKVDNLDTRRRDLPHEFAQLRLILGDRGVGDTDGIGEDMAIGTQEDPRPRLVVLCDPLA
jgi:hypothetical protein